MGEWVAIEWIVMGVVLIFDLALALVAIDAYRRRRRVELALHKQLECKEKSAYEFRRRADLLRSAMDRRSLGLDAFWWGAGSVLDLGGTSAATASRRIARSDVDAFAMDAKAVAGDWAKVGEDMRSVVRSADDSAVTYDDYSDTLYVRLPGQIADSRSLDGDDFVVVNLDADGKAIGLQVLLAASMTSERWGKHYDDVPGDLHAAVARWLIGRGK